jgi:hypothetical protein
MDHVAEWDIDVYLFERDEGTVARVVLKTGANTMHGEGDAASGQVIEISDELAVGRALIDLGNQLVSAAEDDAAEFVRGKS